MNADRAEYLSRGLTGFVAKPIDPDVLMAEIQAAIAAHLPTEIVLSESGPATGGSDRAATSNAAASPLTGTVQRRTGRDHADQWDDRKVYTFPRHVR